MPEASDRFLIVEILEKGQLMGTVTWSPLSFDIDTEDESLRDLLSAFFSKEHAVFAPASSDEGLADDIEEVSFEGMKYANDAITGLNTELKKYDLEIKGGPKGT